MSGQILGTCMIAYSTFFAFINVTTKRWRQGCVISTRGPQKPAGPILYFWGQILNQFKGGKGEKMIGCTGHHHYHKQSELQWRCTKKSEFDWQREREKKWENSEPSLFWPLFSSDYQQGYAIFHPISLFCHHTEHTLLEYPGSILSAVWKTERYLAVSRYFLNTLGVFCVPKEERKVCFVLSSETTSHFLHTTIDRPTTTFLEVELR